jgi:hypothetical protein
MHATVLHWAVFGLPMPLYRVRARARAGPRHAAARRSSHGPMTVADEPVDARMAAAAQTELAEAGRARRLEVQVLSLSPAAYGDGFVSDDARQRRPTRTHQMWDSGVVVHSLIQQRAPVGGIGIRNDPDGGSGG